MPKPFLALTMGDINGVGPEIIAKAAADPEFGAAATPVVFGSIEAYEAARPLAPGAPEARSIASLDDAGRGGEGLAIWDAGATAPPRQPGTLDAEAARCAMVWTEEAVRCAQDRRVAAVVTCPINKEGIHRAGYACDGHTDFIAGLTGAPDWRMSLFSDRMRIVHITGHCSLRAALDAVETQRIYETIRIAADALERLQLPRRRIAVAGLNPHAGEAGAFGREDADEIAPAVARAVEAGVDCSGPHPPDTVFRRMLRGEFDLVVAMYHDQGHIAMKLVAMEEGVNVTLGLPIVRTSVDHGTAYDIAGTGQADPSSLLHALALAARFAAAGQGAPV